MSKQEASSGFTLARSVTHLLHRAQQAAVNESANGLANQGLTIRQFAVLAALNDDDMERYIVKELESVKLGINTFDSAAVELIIRSSQGNLRLCRNLCYGSLIEACRETKKMVTITHVNNILVQPHWRSHEELIKQQVA